MTTNLSVPAVQVQLDPRIYIATIPGRWLLNHSTPSWRMHDPVKGFQRIVKEARAKQIAVAVLDEYRTFPNAIVLATDKADLPFDDGQLQLGGKTRFLVVDGQHRLWAQNHSLFEAQYCCVVHVGLNEVEMANLFLEINDNQKRVPSSLRWDLVRLVRPDDDPNSVKAAELVLQLATDEVSPLFQRIDLTGENPGIQLKQGSLAPELKTLAAHKGVFRDAAFDDLYDVLVRYLIAVRSLDPDRWRAGSAPLCQPRVLRVMLRLLPEIVDSLKKEPARCTPEDFSAVLHPLDLSSLEPDQIRASQGSAGMKQILEQITAQILPGKQ